MKRTQIYLDEDQRKALRMLAADRDSTVSDLIREAIDQMLRDDYVRGDWAKRLGSWQGRVQKRLGDISEERVANALRTVKQEKRGRKK